MKIIVFSGDYSAIYATGNRTRFMNAKPALAALLMTAMLFASPAAIADQRTAQEDIPSNAAGTGIHDSLVAALDRADLVATLSGDGPFTVFAPTDDAFTAAGIDLDSFNTEDEIATKLAELKAAAAHKLQRQEEYPSWEDQLDYIYHNGIDKWKSDVIDPIKTKYPKPS